MTPLWILILAFVGQVFFIYGFLPISTAGFKAFEDRLLPDSIGGIRVNSHSLYKPGVKKLILMVIDALRDDFINGPDIVHNMPYLASLIQNGEGVHFTSKVEPPTVTLPRIKAMTMGTIPNYADVILNVLEQESNSSKQDSFIGRASTHGLHTIFYGDDTWLRLFPNSFLRSDGTSSFYVSDFKEVDDNVTRHLDNELRQDDWDIMILHYLGLDHIGHVHGPYSKLVPTKLLEMDRVIEKLHQGLKKMGHSTLLVVCGDHGMKDTGGHGGATHAETHVPLVFISPSSGPSERYCMKSNVGSRVYHQRDLAPTLSLLFGLSPPSMNLGSAIPCILNKFIPEPDAFLYALHVNAWQVATLLDSAHGSSKDGLYSFEEASELHSKWILSKNTMINSNDSKMANEDETVQEIAEKYVDGISQMTSKVAESMINFDYYSMFLGVSITWQAILILFLDGEAAVFKYDLKKIALLAVVFTTFHFCNCSYGSSFISASSLDHLNPVSSISVLCLAFLLSTSTLKIHHGYQSMKMITHLKESLKTITCCPVYAMLTFGTFLHVISLFSSSFIEEEHQTWQFLSISVIILLGLQMHRQVPLKSSNYIAARRYLVSNPLSTSFKYKFGNQNVHFTTMNDEKAFSHKKECLSIIVVLFIHRILRDFNHTGDKWGHLPDIGDWMSESENIIIRSAVMLFSLIGITIFLILNSPYKLQYSNELPLILVVPCIYAYRAAIGDVSSFNIYPSSRGTIEFRILLILLALIMVSGFHEVFKALSPSETIENHRRREMKEEEAPGKAHLASFVILSHELCKLWVILCSSLNRPADAPIMLAFLFCCQTVAGIMMKTGRFDVRSMSKTFVWMGMAFYFFKGNSNSLASVDLKAAYTGQDNYSALTVGILLFCHTFSMPILALLLLFHYLAMAVSCVHGFDLRCLQRTVDVAATSVISSRLYPVVVYSPFIILQRHHLFIWTVFAPKLIYEAFFTLASLCGLSLVVLLLGFVTQLARLRGK
ncbi:GPI ethanolamine phosphate transferase 2 [Ischnura elegans]|uniref:GPI ethanolamine phosphate transferase 2 n=1 Tax=Ischnura elegans TaxID=197161 RepID=UPI001ED88380|nr:GPI ethanolamine phosphate transferase 2 [Ischnura elegans]XP_046400727.1 GPI ethanolamine phosphate transferase 2 [Ischnura elegans]XP_046400728.1 GPI ethanolamine phosphate transferase 2 [Ischnura elegans]XP_046400729.1 GPI ethanolamine phosphate transferase 2 [Ischnura elegans]XP_046400730.1 GPI ethanolamine phosphate transferase 2 [Ischnura elegans]